jgi:hypothetical protein
MKKIHSFTGLSIAVSFLFLALTGFSQDTKSLPYWKVMLSKASIAGADSCAVFDNATLRWKKVNCAAFGDGTYVKKITGEIQFDFYAADEFGLSNDGGAFNEGYLYFSPTEMNVGFGTNYLDIDASSTVFKTNGGNVQVPNSVGTLALTSDISAALSDVAYNATSWNGVTTIAPSKNAVRDEFENKVSKLTGDVLFNFAGADDLELTNDNGVYAKSWLSFSTSANSLGFNNSVVEVKTNDIDITATQNIDMDAGGAGYIRLSSPTHVAIDAGGAGSEARLKTANLTNDRILQFPDAAGMVNVSVTGSAVLDFGNTLAGAVTDLTVTVTGAVDGDVVSIGVPNASMPATGSYTAWVSAADTVTIRYANNSLTLAQDPASGTFKVSVIKY